LVADLRAPRPGTKAEYYECNFPTEARKMDKDRQIRFLIPPFFLVASLLWAAYLCGQLHYDDSTLKLGISILGVIGVSTLPAGFAIGVLTISALRVLWWILWKFDLVPQKNYELPISKKAMGEIWRLLCASQACKPELDLCAAAAFDHAHLKPAIHEWLMRRWNVFNISCQCVAAMLLSIPMAHALHIEICKWDARNWWASIAVFIVIFICNAVWTWRDTRKMFDLAVSMPEKMLRSETSKKSGKDIQSN
jgi:hypothetical protein